MDRRAAQRLVERFDKYEQLLHDGAFDRGQSVSEAEREALAELLGTLELTNFQRELVQYLTTHVLDEAPFETWGAWIAFLTRYVAVIQDCPLRCVGQGFAFVDEVVARVIECGDENEEDENRVDGGGGVRIQWMWVSKRTGKRRVHTLLLSSAAAVLRGGGTSSPAALGTNTVVPASYQSPSERKIITNA